MITRDSLLILCLLLPAAGIALFSPTIALAAFVIALITGATASRTLASPLVLLAGTLALYLLVGGANISTYRTDTISPIFLREIFWATLCLLAPFAAATLFAPRFTPRCTPRCTPQNHLTEEIGHPLSTQLVWACALPGLLGTGWMLADVQHIPLMTPEARFAIDPKSQLFIETLFIPFILRGITIINAPIPPKTHLAELALWLILLALPGYRGWVIEALGILSLTALSTRPSLRTFLFALVAGGVSLALLVLLALLRRLTQQDLYLPAESLRMHGAEHLPQGFAQLHFTARESLYVAQELWKLRLDDLAGGSSLLFADLLTILPGTQPAAGDILGDTFGRVLAGGLTASFPGVLFYEYGNGAYVIMALVGLVFGLWWHWIKKKHPSTPTHHALFFLTYLFLLHLFHRGTLKPSYLLLPLMLWSILFILPRRKNPERPVPS